jgi:hypothetical protein
MIKRGKDQRPSPLCPCHCIEASGIFQGSKDSHQPGFDQAFLSFTRLESNLRSCLLPRDYRFVLGFFVFSRGRGPPRGSPNLLSCWHPVYMWGDIVVSNFYFLYVFTCSIPHSFKFETMRILFSTNFNNEKDTHENFLTFGPLHLERDRETERE